MSKFDYQGFMKRADAADKLIAASLAENLEGRLQAKLTSVYASAAAGPSYKGELCRAQEQEAEPGEFYTPLNEGCISNHCQDFQERWTVDGEELFESWAQSHVVQNITQFPDLYGDSVSGWSACFKHREQYREGDDCENCLYNQGKIEAYLAMEGDPMTTKSCEICGEPLDGRGNGEAEMYDPAEVRESVICHADCGLARGYEIA